VPRGSVTLRLLIAVAIVGLGCGLYANSLHAPFVFDDLQNIEQNSMIRVSGWDPSALFRAAFESPSPRPVANLSFALSWALGGGDPFAFHCANVAIHILNALLVWALAMRVVPVAARASGRELSGERTLAISAASGLLFVAHPIATQAVTYIVQRMTSLAVCFGLIAFLLFLIGRDAPAGRRRYSYWFVAALSWGLAVGSKQIAAPLPLFALAYEWFFLQDLSREWLLRRRWWLLGVASVALAGVLGIVVFHDFALQYAHRPFDMVERQLTQFRVLWFYLGLILLPSPARLNLTHEFSISHSLFDPLTTLFALLGLLGLAAFAVMVARRERLLSFTIFWFLGTLAIESSIVALELVYEHRLYLPLVWLSILGSDAIFRLSSRRLLPAIAVVALLVGGMSVWTIERNAHWRDALTLWGDAVRKSPGDHRAHNNLGDAHMREGHLGDARKSFERSVAIAPDYARARHNLAIALHESGEIVPALLRYREALELEPANAELHRNLGAALEEDGQFAAALDAYERATRLSPRSARAHHDLGLLRVKTGDEAAGLAQLERACELEPGNAKSHYVLGILLAERSRFAAAVEALERASRLEPENAAYRTVLGMALEGSGARDDAIAQLREALRLDPGSAQARGVLQRLEGAAPAAE